MNRRKIFFNEELHKYHDDIGRTYTSMTTIIGKYEKQFDTKATAAEMVKKYNKIKGHRYYNMTQQEIIDKWTHMTTSSQDRGNERHNFMEDAIKKTNNYSRVAGKFINDYIYTLDTVIDDKSFGRIDLDFFEKIGIRERYPEIYKTIAYYTKLGFYIYAEMGVYHADLLVSGLIDVPMINWDTNEFIILDWKTNKDKLHFKAGYYKRTKLGDTTDLWIPKPYDTMKPPLSGIQSSHGSTYTLQLSGYAWLIEQLSGMQLKCVDLILCHIRPKEVSSRAEILTPDDDFVEFHNIEYWKDDVERMFRHHFKTYTAREQAQGKFVFTK